LTLYFPRTFEGIQITSIKNQQVMIIEELYYRLTNRSSNAWLDAKEDCTCTNELNKMSSQRWLFENVGDECYRIMQEFTNLVLEGNSRGDIYLRQWNGTDQQKWSVDNVGEGYCRIAHKATSRVLDACFNGKVHNIYWNGAYCQQWKMETITSAMGAKVSRIEYNQR
jgi:hypothetical protein